MNQTLVNTCPVRRKGCRCNAYFHPYFPLFYLKNRLTFILENNAAAVAD